MYSTGIAYLLWLVSGFGALGFHRFYLGKFLTGLLWMFTGGLFMMGAIYDLFTLPFQVTEANLRAELFDRSFRQNHRPEPRPGPTTESASGPAAGHGAAWRYADDAQFRVVNSEDNDKDKPTEDY